MISEASMEGQLVESVLEKLEVRFSDKTPTINDSKASAGKLTPMANEE